MGEGQGAGLGPAKKSRLGVLCHAGGIAPLAARSIRGEAAEIVYGLVMTAVLLAITLHVRGSSDLRKFWELPFAFFVLAVVPVLNNSVPPFFLAYVLHEHPMSAVFPLGLIAGYLMRSSNGVICPAIFHAGVDIPIYLGFLTYTIPIYLGFLTYTTCPDSIGWGRASSRWVAI
jgi:hypothetical protein